MISVYLLLEFVWVGLSGDMFGSGCAPTLDVDSGGCGNLFATEIVVGHRFICVGIDFRYGCLCRSRHKDHFAQSVVVVGMVDYGLDEFLGLLSHTPSVQLSVDHILAVVIEVIGHASVAVVLECIAAGRSRIVHFAAVNIVTLDKCDAPEMTFDIIAGDDAALTIIVAGETDARPAVHGIGIVVVVEKNIVAHLNEEWPSGGDTVTVFGNSVVFD